MVDERAEQGTVADTPEADHSHDIYTLANIITVLRLILVPIFFTVLITGRNDVLAFALYVIAASTDWLDGQIARRTGTVTEIGKAIDPLVDRLLIASGVLGLYVEGRLPLWVLLLLVLRDLYLLGGAAYLARHRVPPVRVIYVGKVTTALLLVGFSGLILNVPQVPGLGLVDAAVLPGLGSEPAAIWMFVVYAGIATSLVTAVRYTMLAASQLADARKGSTL